MSKIVEKVLTNSVAQAKSNINIRSNKHIKSRHKIIIQDDNNENDSDTESVA